ncbi:hypothetical protein HY745_14725 [Candidatus Desantisbacteria bacterium]|nr:hypothetical protein [Candidatus Desantisbacteria bacterium]
MKAPPRQPLAATPQEGNKNQGESKKNMFNYLLLPKNIQLKQKSKELRKAGVLSEVIFWQTFKDKKF